jgi:hypothetical protein
MNRQSAHTCKPMLWACVPLLSLSFCMQTAAAAASAPGPKPGIYCPGTEILLVAAEELSASLDLTMRSRAALINKDLPTAFSELTSARTTLHLAASRGAAARTILLIDAIIQARAGENNLQMLVWFPLLRTNLLSLPNDETVSAVSDLFDGAEDIMQGDKNGDPMKLLRDARHMLACDGLDIPLQAAMQAQDNLMKQPGQNIKKADYDTLLESLRSALNYALQSSEE